MTRSRSRGFFGTKDMQSVAAAIIPKTPVKVTEVFTPSIPAERGFVGRELEMKDLRQKGLAVPGTQVVIWGESGAGKSSLVKKVLEETGRTAVKTSCTPDSSYQAILEAAFSGTGAFYVAESTETTDVSIGMSGSVGSELIGAKIETTAEVGASTGMTRFPIAKPQLTPQRLLRELGARNLSWVIEDFHKVPKETRESIAHALKVFSDDGAKYSKTTVIVIGVSESVDELVARPVNVGKRLIDIEVPPLEPSELGKILDAGEGLLHLDYSAIRERLLSTSVGVASITHALALNCCDERELTEASPEQIVFSDAEFESAVEGYARTRSGDLKSRFRKALLVHRERKFANTEIILRVLTRLPEDGGTVGQIFQAIRAEHPSYPQSNLTNYLRDLQGEERGALLRKTNLNKYRFDEPLQHAYAKALFNLTEAVESTADKDAATWTSAIKELLSTPGFRAAFTEIQDASASDDADED